MATLGAGYEFILDAPFAFVNQTGPSPPPPQAANQSEDAVARMRAEWEEKYSKMDMPPPPPAVFATRDELIAEAKSFAEDHGYTLVIGHSSRHNGEHTRCWLTCELGGVYRNRHNLTPELRKRKRESRKLDCPMKVLGTRRKFENGWYLHLPDASKAAHNHPPIDRNSSSPPPPELPELEQSLFEWHRQCQNDGIVVHGNTIKAKAIELYKTMPMYRNKGPFPDLGNNWLNDFRKRNGIHTRQTKTHSAPRLSTGSHFVTMEDSLPITHAHRELFKTTRAYVKDYMSRFDPSHDYNHVLRVLALANRILTKENNTFPAVQYDSSAVFLAALVHDVGDKKYADPDESSENQIAEILLERGASDELALKVQMIAKNVSYSTEIKNPRLNRAILLQHPELAIVQDADRLDALGAIGIGRAFTYGGSMRPESGLQGTIAHFTNKLAKLEGIMKTETGKMIARERTQRIEQFKNWWDEESLSAY